MYFSWREGNEQKNWEGKLREEGRKAGMFIGTSGNKRVSRRK